MTATDEDALICDFAETYHIYDYRGLPLRYAAVLACGLRDDSRIKCKMAGQKVPTETLLQASILDALNLLVWFNTKDGRKNRNRPKEILRIFVDDPADKPSAFDSVDAFEKRRKEIIYGN